MIIPENERSKEPMKGERVLTHPDMARANEWILSDKYIAPVRDFCIFVPCAKHKPYHLSPSHVMYDRIIFSILKPEETHIVVFGTCGVTPRELDEEYPFMDYEFMLGRCDVVSVKEEFVRNESKKLARYLEKTRDNYKHRVAYCMGDFRKAMEKALTMTDIKVCIVPKPETMEANIQPDKLFKYGSLSRKPYLQDLSDTLTSLKGIKNHTVGISEQSLNDTDWYLL
jgi:predicted RNA-binding protein